MSEMLPVLRIPTTVHNGVRLECYFHVAYLETSRYFFCVPSHHQVQP